MTRRPPLLTLLASLAIHIGALALLIVFASEESHPSALFIDLSVQEVGVVSEPRAAATEGGLRQMRPGSARPIERITTVPSPPPAVAPAPPSSPELAPPPEREVTTSRPPEPRLAEPALGAVSSRETAPEVGPSSTSASAVEASPKPGGASADQTSATSASDVGHRATPAPSAVSGESTGRTGARVALAPTGPLGGEPGSEYGGYLAHVRRRIQESLQYPLAARRRGLKGTVHLEILIKPNGAISAVSVTSSSSHWLLDEAALEAVRSLAPQPFPSGLMPRPLRVRLPVVFDLQ